MKFNFKPPKIDFKPGTVILAGSGPGSKDLITLKVYIAIKLADVIIYDALVNKNLLKGSKKNSILIFAGKTKNTKACSQNEINQWMVYHAKKNKKILRLKGGDPSFFSRGSQEIDFLKKNSINFRVFTGITSSQQAIKSCHYSFYNESGVCNFVTGHKKIDKKSIIFDFKKIYKNGGRILLYMGVGQIKKISSQLINLGMKRNTKVCIVSNTSFSYEKIINTTLDNVEKSIISNKINPPSIIIIN